MYAIIAPVEPSLMLSIPLWEINPSSDVICKSPAQSSVFSGKIMVSNNPNILVPSCGFSLADSVVLCRNSVSSGESCETTNSCLTMLGDT